jgi:micrococcal nuclease
MKLVIKFSIAAFLLLGIAACSQESGTKTSNQTEKVTQAPGTSTKSAADDSTGNTPASSTNNAQQGANVATPENQVPVTLTATVDGDTIKVNYNGKEETVRYLLIDTPEEKKPGVCVQPYAMDAANRNKQLLTSGKVTLEFEQGKSKTDKYGRLLAYVFVNGASVQETLLKEGYARVAYIYEPPYKYLNQYRNDENTAKSQQLNIWSKSGYVTDTGFKGCADSSAGSTNQQNSTNNTSSQTANTSGTEFFANCTELRKKYPDGVPKGHPAYRDTLDRDQDGFACER